MQTLVCFDTKVDPVVGYGTSGVVYVQVRALPGIPTRYQSLCKGPKGLKPLGVPPVPPRTFALILCGYQELSGRGRRSMRTSHHQATACANLVGIGRKTGFSDQPGLTLKKNHVSIWLFFWPFLVKTRGRSLALGHGSAPKLL